jgi:hypothetical protein
MLIDIEISGATPLIMNKFTDEAALAATNGSRGAMTGSRGSPREQAEKKLYTGRAGLIMLPQPNVLRCIIDAGAFFKIGRNKITTQKSSLIPSCVSVLGIELPLASKEGWRVDERPVRIPATGGRILCYRPIFDDWRVSFTIDLDTGEMTEKLLREIVDKAGKAIGLGDFRPACKGPFGRFSVVKWREHEVAIPS